jgi:hypothetical protein
MTVIQSCQSMGSPPHLRHHCGLLSVGPKTLENDQFDDLHMQEQRLLHKRFLWGAAPPCREQASDDPG